MRQFLDEVDARESGFGVMIKVGEAFEKVAAPNFSMESMREKGGFDVMIKVGEAFQKVAAPISR